MIVLCYRGVFEGARRNGTICLAQFNHFRGEKHNCLLPLPLSWCYACCVCCASCVFRSGASESASGSLPTRSTRSAGAKCFTPIIPHPIFFSHACTRVLCYTPALVPNGTETCVFQRQLPSAYAFALVLHCPRVLGVLCVVVFCFRRCLWSRSTRATCSAACFCPNIHRPLCFYGAGAMPAPLYPATHSQWLQKGGKLGEWKHPKKLKRDAFVVFQIKQATSMCVCFRFRLASRLAPLSSSPPCVAAGWHAGWVNRKKKGAKDKQEKQFWLTNLTTYQVYHVHGFAVHVTTILRCLLSPTACCTLSQVKAPKGKPHAPHVVQDVRNKKDGYLKYKKVFYAFCAFYLFPFPLPLDLPLVVCYAFCAFSALCALPLVLPLGLPPCVLHVLHVLQIPCDRLWTWIQDEGTTESSDEDE